MPGNIAEEDDPIAGCRRGDTGAQRRLFGMYKDRVYSMAVFLCKNPTDAAEITQEVFLKVFSGLAQFRGESKFETWLYRIVANTWRDYTRKSRRSLLLDSAFWRDQGSHAVSVVEQLAQTQTDEAVRSAIASLPEKFRLAVVLRYVEELSYNEIAAALGCPPGTVAARLTRAHKMLALKLTRLRR